jgi:hypothetical protein
LVCSPIAGEHSYFAFDDDKTFVQMVEELVGACMNYRCFALVRDFLAEIRVKTESQRTVSQLHPHESHERQTRLMKRLMNQNGVCV